MKTKDENRLTMFDAVKSIFTAYISIVNSILALKAVDAALFATILAIHAADSLATSAGQGTATNKKLLKQTAVDLMYPIVASLFAFAVKTGDAILEAKTKIAESTLKATADELLPDLMSNYIALATANVAILTSDYGINAAYITAAT